VGKVDAVFEAFSHGLRIPRLRLHSTPVRISVVGLKLLKRVKPFYPRAKAPGLYGLFL
jgi:hypothetical protein